MTVRSLALLSLAFSAAGCVAHNLRFVAPDTTPSSRYDCGVDQSECTPATHDVPEEATQSGTQFIRLPRQCQGRFNQVLVLDADSSSPRVTVTCAPSENDPNEVMN